MATLQTLTLAGQRFVVLPEAEYKRLAGKTSEPLLPPADADGNYPAVETMRSDSRAKNHPSPGARRGSPQVELARRANIRPERLIVWNRESTRQASQQ